MMSTHLQILPPSVPTKALGQVFAVDLLGRQLHCMTAPALVEEIWQACRHNQRRVIAHCNVHGFNLSMICPRFYRFLQSADIVHCDGIGILKAIGYLGRLKLPVEYRVSYTILMPLLLERCQREGLSLYLLGGNPTHLERALSNLRLLYPHLQVTGHHGYFAAEDPEENAAIVESIRASGCQILIVGMGMPRQEYWIEHHRDHLTVNAILSGGAVVDRLAGVVPDCPKWLSDVGLEWLYRLSREPQRLSVRYLLGNPTFVLTLALARLQGFRVSWVEQTDPAELTLPVWQVQPPEEAKIRLLGQVLTESGILNPTQLEEALVEHRLTGKPFREVISRHGWAREEALEVVIEKLLRTEISR
ncbi:MAG: WecB/TagA/CpsF family glycosyltransferase [Thermostichus sp. DG02_5_bins_236]